MYKLLVDKKIIESEEPGLFAGHKKLKIFGRLHCWSGEKMYPKNRVFFKDMFDAIAQGYRPCKNCKPLNDSDFKTYKAYLRYYHIFNFKEIKVKI